MDKQIMVCEMENWHQKALQKLEELGFSNEVKKDFETMHAEALEKLKKVAFVTK